METLGKIFGSEVKVKLMRLFLFNPEHNFSPKDIIQRVKENPSKVRRELGNLDKMGLLKRKLHTEKANNKQIKKPIKKPNKKSKQSKQSKHKKIDRHTFTYSLDNQFAYLAELQNFLVNVEPLHPKELIRRLGRLGTMKLVLTSGVFIQDPESRVDILIVGDGVKKTSLENTIKILESEVGKELKYAYFTTEDFKYRLSMYDKLTRDILDYPHKKVLNRLGVL